MTEDNKEIKVGTKRDKPEISKDEKDADSNLNDEKVDDKSHENPESVFDNLIFRNLMMKTRKKIIMNRIMVQATRKN